MLDRRDERVEDDHKSFSAWARQQRLPALLAVWIVATLFNLTKAFHIDDTAYLRIAEGITRHPWHPMAGTLYWGVTPAPFAEVNQPHLFMYAIAGWTTLFGSSEIVLHLFLSLFVLASIYLFHRLSVTVLHTDSIVPVVLLFLAPAFLPSQNLMTDVPLLCLVLLFFWCVIEKTNSTRWWLLAGVTAAAAVLTKYSALALIPILGALLVRQRRLDVWYAVTIPVAALAAWCLFNVWDYGAVHVIGRPVPPFSRRAVMIQTWSALLALGAVAPWFALAPPASSRARWITVLASLGTGIAGVLAYAGAADSPGLFRINVALAFAMCANGAAVAIAAAAALAGAWRRGSRVIAETLVLWWAGLGLFVCLFAPFMAVRHVLLFLPAILLALGLSRDLSWRRPAVKMTVAVSLLLGCALAISDWQYANVYRREASTFRRKLGADGRIWFTGHWGWQWYAESAGMMPYEPGRSVLQPGDVVITPKLVDRQPIAAEDSARLRPVRVVSIRSSWTTLLRTMSAGEGGFYTNGLGQLPWKVSVSPLEEFTVSTVH